TEEQRLLRDSVRKLLQKHAPPEYVRKHDRERTYPEELFQACAEAGLLALPFPEEYGGAGGSVLDMVIVAEEIARVSADLVMAYTGGIFCGLNLVRMASEEQKRDWLPKFLAGKIKFSISMSEADAGSDIGAMRTTAVKDGNEWVIDGQKLWASTAGAQNKGGDCVMSGLQVERPPSSAGNVGAAQAVVDLAVQYAKDRKQFGRPIGSNQAIAHMLADMQTEVEAARTLMWRAAWMVSNGQDALREITMAKLFTSETYVKIASQGMQVLGGFGYSAEFDMERHFRDSRAATIAAGTSQIQRNLIANLMGLKVQQFLSAPASRGRKEVVT